MTVGEFIKLCFLAEETKCVIYGLSEDKDVFEGTVDSIPEEFRNVNLESFEINQSSGLMLHIG